MQNLNRRLLSYGSADNLSLSGQHNDRVTGLLQLTLGRRLNVFLKFFASRRLNVLFGEGT